MLAFAVEKQMVKQDARVAVSLPLCSCQYSTLQTKVMRFPRAACQVRILDKVAPSPSLFAFVSNRSVAADLSHCPLQSTTEAQGGPTAALHGIRSPMRWRRVGEVRLLAAVESS